MSLTTVDRPLTGPVPAGAHQSALGLNLSEIATHDRVAALHAELTERLAGHDNLHSFQSFITAAHRMRTYSISNQLLLWSQLAHVQIVFGYKSWSAHGRHVRAGEKGLKIFAPVTARRTNTDTNSAPSNETSTVSSTDRVVVGFKLATVFDISMTDITEGAVDPLQVLTPATLTGDAPAGVLAALLAIIAGDGFTLERGECHGADGYTDYRNRIVRIRGDIDDAHTLLVAAHELAHVRLHEPTLIVERCRGRAEVEAESVASLIATIIGIDSDTNSLPYLSGWFSPRAFAPRDSLLDGVVAPTGCAVDMAGAGVYSWSMRFRAARLVLSDGGVSWTVVGHDGVPIDAAEEFLAWRSLRSSPLTVRRYAYALASFFDFLDGTGVGWEQVTLPVMAGFVSEQRAGGDRAPSTVNTTVAGVVAFYEFQIRHGCDVASQLVVWRQVAARRFKPFLAGLAPGGRQRSSSLTLAEPARRPMVVSASEFAALLDACSTSRDRFLLSLLHATGMRIGQALGLWHRDMRTWEGAIDIVPRDANPNGARAKTREVHTVHVPIEIGRMYSDYVTRECADIDSEFVFVCLQGRDRGRPWSYRGVDRVVRTLRARTGIYVRLHALRHTHATDLLRGGVPIEIASKRLTHTSVSTTADIYAHLDDEDVASQMRSYWSRRKGS